MNSNLLIIKYSDHFETFLKHVKPNLNNIDYEIHDGISTCKNKRILFVIELNEVGYDLELLSWIGSISNQKDYFEGSVAGIVIKSNSELYTKTLAQDVILHCNRLGLSFVGHSVIEITKGYVNFLTWKKTIDKPLEEIATMCCNNLIEKILKQDLIIPKKKKVLALHSSSYKTSNTLGLWHMIKEHLVEFKCLDTNEIHIKNGEVADCKGCSFQTCLHFGNQESCYYGGVMVEEVLPAIKDYDIIVWVCPNYNDSVSSNLLAVINRLTVLYRQISFNDKVFFAVIVSGNSGSDALAKQLIGALNINKGFLLPPNFSIMETANDPLKVFELEDIQERAKKMAYNINALCDNK